MSDDDGRTVPRLEGLETIYDHREPDRPLEERVVARLVGEGFLRGRRRRWTAPLPWILRVAAAVVLLAAGFALGRRESGGLPSGRRFMLLLWEGPGFGAEAPEPLVEEYARWATQTREAGTPLTGAELGEPAAWLPPSGGGAVEGAPAAGGRLESGPAGGGFRLGGYFIVEVTDAEAARTLAAGHPHRRHGGWVEVVPVR